MLTSEIIAARDAAFAQRQADEARIVKAIQCNANRVEGQSALWSGEVDGVLYFVQERYDGRSVWYTAHVGSPNGPRVG